MSLRQIDHALARWMQRHGHALLRYGLGCVFVWFGAPKWVPGLSPAESLVAATVPCCDPAWFVPLLGTVEVLIGVCLLVRRWMRLGLISMAVHMIGAAMPLFTLPEVAWRSFPVATLEGQYILKNMVLVAGAIVLGGAARPGSARGREAETARLGSARAREPRREPSTTMCLTRP